MLFGIQPPRDEQAYELTAETQRRRDKITNSFLGGSASLRLSSKLGTQHTELSTELQELAAANAIDFFSRVTDFFNAI